MNFTPDQASGPHQGAIHVQVLGELNLISSRAQGLGSLGGRYHVRAALALLAATPGGLEKEALMDALWPDSGVRSAANRLHHTTHLLRRRLCQLAWPADWIHIGGDSISLDPAVTSDARSLHEAARNPGELNLMQLASLVLSIDRSASWVPDLDAGELGTRVRERCAQDFQTVLYEACETAVSHGDTPIRRSLLEVLLQSDPSNEWAWRETMILDMQASRRFHVQRSFAAVSRELTLRLGLRPSLKTLKIAQSALDTDRIEAIAPALPTGVIKPADTAVMTNAILAGGLYNVFGLDGVGKTTLMRTVETQLATTGMPVVSYWDAAKLSPLPSWPTFIASGEIVVVDHLKPTSGIWFEQLVRAASRKERPRTIILLSGTPVLGAELAARLPADLHSGLLSVLPASVFNPVQSQVVLSRLLAPDMRLTESQLTRLAGLTGGIALAGQKLAACLETMSADEVLDRPDALFETGCQPYPLQQAGRQSLQTSFDDVWSELSPGARQIYPALGLVAGIWSSGRLHEWLAQYPGCESPRDFAHLMAEFGAVGLVSRNETGAVAVLPLARVHARRHAVELGLFESLLSRLLDFLAVEAKVSLVPEGSERHCQRIHQLMSLEPLLRPLIEDARRFSAQGYLRFVCLMGELALAKGELSFGIRLCSQALELVRDDKDARLRILQTLIGLLAFARADASTQQLCSELNAPAREALDQGARSELEARLLRAYKASRLPVPPGFSNAWRETIAHSGETLPAFLAARLAFRQARHHFAQEAAPESIKRLIRAYGKVVECEPSQLQPQVCRLIADHCFLLADFEDARLWLTLAREHWCALSRANAAPSADDSYRDWLLETFVKSDGVGAEHESAAFSNIRQISEPAGSAESLRLRVLCGARHVVMGGAPDLAAQLLGVFEWLDPGFIRAPMVAAFLRGHVVEPAKVLSGESRAENLQRLDDLLESAYEPVMH